MGNSLNPDDILSAEFEYIAQTAFQAHEDRARVTTFYLVSVGSFVAAILGAQFEENSQSSVNLAFATLFVVLSLMGLLTLLQLARLRQAWFESVSAMNRIKEYYIERSPEGHLGDAFLWRAGTIPAKFKRWSVAYLLALQVAVLGGAALGAAAIFVGLMFDQLWWWVAIIVGVAFTVIQMSLHRRLLSR